MPKPFAEVEHHLIDLESYVLEDPTDGKREVCVYSRGVGFYSPMSDYTDINDWDSTSSRHIRGFHVVAYVNLATLTFETELFK